MARDRRKAKGRNSSGAFVAIPHRLMDSEDFLALSGSALKVLLGLLRQYRGKNNGDLSASFTQARGWGVGSKETLSNALNELQERGMIERTREGRFINPGGRCALYAVTWLPIDECAGKLEVAATITPRRQFSTEKSKTPGTEIVPTGYGNRTDRGLNSHEKSPHGYGNRTDGMG